MTRVEKKPNFYRDILEHAERLRILEEKIASGGTGGGVTAETDPIAKPALDAHTALVTGVHGIPSVPTGYSITMGGGGTWIASQLAASTHTHVIADVSGLATALAGKVSLAGDTMTGVLTTPGVTIPPTAGAAKGRFATLPGIANWFGMFLNASFNGSAWVLDDTSVPGWFFKLDSRAGNQQFAVFRIPAGANPHTDESAVLIVDVNGLVTVAGRITGVATAIGVTDAVPKGQFDSGLATTEKTANKNAVNGYAGLDASGLLSVGAVPVLPESKITNLTTDLAAKENAGVAIPKSLIDAKGDLLLGTADNTVARLGVSTDGKVLKADSTATAGVSWADVNTIAGSLIMPAGSIVPWPGNIIPAGFLPCDGTTRLRSAYPALWDALREGHAGTAGDPAPWGNGDAVTTFNLPDMSGRVPLGVGTATGAAGATAHTLAQKGGEEKHTLTNPELPTHGHPVEGYDNRFAAPNGLGAVSVHPTAGTNWGIPWQGGSLPARDGIGGTETRNQAHNVLPPYTAMSFIIAAYGVSLPSSAPNLVFEGWHKVNDAGEPAFQGNWVNYDVTAYEALHFRKTPEGKVQVVGMIKPSAGTNVANSQVFFLPAGYRPVKNRIFTQMSSNGAADVRVDAADGKVYVSTVGLSWVAVDFEFDTAQINFPVGPISADARQVAKVTAVATYTFAGLDLATEGEYRLVLRGYFNIQGADRKITARLGGQLGGARGLTHRFYKDVNSENTFHDFVEEQRDGSALVIGRSDYVLSGDLVCTGILAKTSDATYTGESTFRPYGGSYGVGILGYNFTGYHAIVGSPTTLEINFGGGVFTGTLVFEKISKTIDSVAGGTGGGGTASKAYGYMMS